MQARKTLKLDRYEVMRPLGSSAPAAYLATDTALGRHVVLQFFPRAAGADRVQRFRDAVRSAGRVRHPNVAALYATGLYKSVPYLAMEHVPGVTLREQLEKSGPMSTEQATPLFLELLNGLAQAHRQGVLHLGLSPVNIVIDKDWGPKILHLGLSSILPRSAAVVPYLSPEHFGDSNQGPNCDVFALGLIFYEMLTGRPAMDVSNSAEHVKRLCERPIELTFPPQAEIELGLRQFILGATRKRPSARYANCIEMKVAFSDWLETQTMREQERLFSGDTHGTVSFLFRRMQRKKDFPALSHSLSKINAMTSADSTASAKQLAGVILSDYALTNKLLKLANSAFYAQLKDGVSSVSAAIRVLGFDQVRLAANSLIYFSHLNDKSATPELKDALIGAFMSGIVTRHLARRARLPSVEEAFVCGMFQNLGELLTIYYFPEEHAEINLLVDDYGVDAAVAAHSILGISFPELGAAIGRQWKFPENILECMLRRTGDSDPGAELLHEFAAYANAACNIASVAGFGEENEALGAIAELFPRVTLTPKQSVEMLRAAAARLDDHSDLLGIDVEASPFMKRLRVFLSRAEALLEENDELASPDLPKPELVRDRREAKLAS